MTLPIIDFLTERMQEFDPSYEYRKGTAFSDLFIQPLALIVQPLRDEMTESFTNQSLKRILDSEDPNSYSETAVDELIENYFVYRRSGSKSGGIVRVLYDTPKDLNATVGNLEFKSVSGQSYLNRTNVSITRQQMTTQVYFEFFYVDIDIESTVEGQIADAAVNEIISISDSDAVRAFNQFAISGGADRETNLELIARTQKSIGTRDLNVGKGFNAIMFETFKNQLTELQPIGFGDPEMMRDIKFNYHTGGRIDGWVKTPNILSGFFDVVGLTIDPTRFLKTSSNVQMFGTEEFSLGVQNLTTDQSEIKAYNIDNLDSTAFFVSYVDLEAGVDLFTLDFISLSLDGSDFKDIRVAGAIPSETQIGEIVNRINVAFGKKVASIVVNPQVISKRRTAYTGSNNSNHVYDPSEHVFRNVKVGDRFYITFGPNKGTYYISSIINENELLLTTNIVTKESEIPYRISRIGSYLKLTSLTQGINSKIAIKSPASRDCLPLVFGLDSSLIPYEYNGSGEFLYTAGTDYEVDVINGLARRLIGITKVSSSPTGQVNNTHFFDDPSTDVFLNVEVGDLLSITNATNTEIIKDYRVLEKINNNRLRVDSFFPLLENAIEYNISKTGIKNASTVRFEFDYHPMSIDIGDRISLDVYGRKLGIRPGREEQTIKDMALLYVESVELIDPVSQEPLGVILNGDGGYGRGGYGRGGYGVGSQAQWFLNVNKPELRFSDKEDSFIVIDSAYLGQSFRVNYKYCPEIRSFQSFVESDSERVLDADILIKHFIPVVVSTTIKFKADPNNPNTPTNDVIKTEVENFINKLPVGDNLDVSDILNVIYDLIDSGKSRKVSIKLPVTLEARIHNTDGTFTIIKSDDRLEVPNEDIPPFTVAPLSPRTAHFIAGKIEIIKE